MAQAVSTKRRQAFHPNAAVTAPLRGPGMQASVSVGAAWAGWLRVVLLIAAGLAARVVNLQHIPSLTSYDDEGIYMAQAWAVLREGRLSPYTYVYDHAPAGWLLLAGWLRLVGGAHAFGSAIDTGRVLMVLLGTASVPLLYTIARRLGCAPWAAMVGALLYALSPLAALYGRLVLLDTIMVFWLLLAFVLLLAPRAPSPRLRSASTLAASGAIFGVAALTKETAVVLAPAALAIMLWGARPERRPGRALALAAWLLPAVAVIGIYLAYAALRGELLPSGTIHVLGLQLGSATPHISLIDTMRWQASRSGGGALSFQNMFWDLVRTDWLPRDPVTLVAGGIAIVGNFVLWAMRRTHTPQVLAAALLGLLPLAYLARGGLVYSFYVLAALPWLCLNVAVLATALAALLPKALSPVARVGGLAAAVLVTSSVWVGTGSAGQLYAAQPAGDARAAVQWVKQSLPPESRMIINDNWWTDLHENGFGGPGFPNAHSHWKVALETGVRDGVFQNDWRTVDYLFITAGTKDAFASTNNGVAQEALRRAHQVRSWGSGPEALELWQVDRPGPQVEALVSDSARYMARQLSADGAYAQPDGTVLARNQAAAMLRAVWSDDRAHFSTVWSWTQRSLLKPTGLLASSWRGGAVVDGRSASDADTDAALALLLASRRWHDQNLEAAGQALVRAIWSNEVLTAGGSPYMLGGDWAAQEPVLPVRTANLAPYAYHVFQEVDSEHNWLGLVGSTYQALGAAGGLTPHVPVGGWIGVDRASGAVVAAPSVSESAGVAGGPQGTVEAAAMTYVRIALHRRWTVNWSPGGDGRAAAFLEQAPLATALPGAGPGDSSGARDEMARAAATLAVQLIGEPGAAPATLASRVVGPAQREGSDVWWADPHDLGAQQWGWIAAALYTDDMRDWWHAQ